MKTNIIKILIIFAILLSFYSIGIVYSANSKEVNLNANVLNTNPVISGITPFDKTSNSIKILFNTNIPAICWLFYGTTTDYGSIIKEEENLKKHIVNLQNLSENTLYHYKIRCTTDDNLVAETVDQNFKTTIKPIEVVSSMKNDSIIENLASNPVSKSVNLILLIGIVLATLLVIIIPQISNLPLLSIYDYLSSLLNSIFIPITKKWGIVYDSETNQPVAKTLVKLLDFDTKKILYETVTNKLGEYGFNIKEGVYYLVVAKKDCIFPSKVTEADYHKEKIILKNNMKININIPLDVNEAVVSEKIGLLENTIKVINFLRIPILMMGTLVSILFLITNKSVVNIMVVLVYAISWLYEFYSMSLVTSVGNIYDYNTSKSIGNAIVRFFDKKNKKLIYTSVTNENGLFKAQLPKGNYEVSATKNDYQISKLDNININEKKFIFKNIVLKKS